MEAKTAVAEFMNLFNVIKFKPEKDWLRTTLMSRYLEWPNVPAAEQADTILWLEDASAKTRSFRITVTVDVDIADMITEAYEKMLRLFKDRDSVAGTIPEMFEAYDDFRNEVGLQP